MGVRGINARGSDVAGMVIADAPYLLTVTEKGFGKRTPVEDYRLISRGGSGVTNIKITEKNGDVAGIKCVDDGDEIMIVGRNTQGVRVIDLEVGDTVATVARIIKEEEIGKNTNDNNLTEEDAKKEDNKNNVKFTVQEVDEFLDKNGSDNNKLEKRDFTLECLMDTVLIPGLRQCLKLGIGRISSFPGEVGDNSF